MHKLMSPERILWPGAGRAEIRDLRTAGPISIKLWMHTASKEVHQFLWRQQIGEVNLMEGITVSNEANYDVILGTALCSCK